MQIDKKYVIYFLSFLGAGVAMIALAGIGIGIGTAGGAALEGIARQPEVTSTIQQTLLLLVVLPELFLAFLAFVVAIIIIQTIRNCRC